MNQKAKAYNIFFVLGYQNNLRTLHLAWQCAAPFLRSLEEQTLNLNSIIPWRNKTRSLQIKPSLFRGHLSLPTFWSPKRICLRAFLETFILHRKILFSPGSVELLGERESPPLVAELEPELVLIWRPLISSD